MIIPRALTQSIINQLQTTNKGVVIYGARQVGKTTLATHIINTLKLKTVTINGDQSKHQDIISSRNLDKLASLLTGYQLLFVDEAQRIPEICLNLKIILDNFKSLKVLVTGSSSLDLASKISEPLTGRVWNHRLHPISFLELSSITSHFELDNQLESRLVFGSYPEIFSLTNHQLKQSYLTNLTDANLYRDLIEFGDIKNSGKIRDLLKLLAFQIGSEVSLTELGNKLGLSKDTVSRYIDLLEKSFIIFRLSGFNRNLRKEVTKMDKIFFYDLGIRNTLIDNFKSLSDRNDIGQLWENFLVLERIKYLNYSSQPASTYFWRTHTGAELDYVEDQGGNLHGFEFKFSKQQSKPPATWLSTYTQSSFALINRDNYLDFVTSSSIR